MNDQDSIQFKLSLAKAWLENGQETLARSIISSIFEERDESQNEHL